MIQALTLVFGVAVVRDQPAHRPRLRQARSAGAAVSAEALGGGRRSRVIAADAAARLRRRGATERRWASVTLWVGIGIIAVITFVSFAAPLLGFDNPNKQDLLDALQPPSMGAPVRHRHARPRHPHAGLYGGRIDLTFAFVTTIVPFFLGALLGAFAGYRGGWLDTVVNRIVDIGRRLPVHRPDPRDRRDHRARA